MSHRNRMGAEPAPAHRVRIRGRAYTVVISTERRMFARTEGGPAVPITAHIDHLARTFLIPNGCSAADFFKVVAEHRSGRATPIAELPSAVA